MIDWFSFIIGAFIGFNLGVFFLSLAYIAKEGDK